MLKNGIHKRQEQNKNVSTWITAVVPSCSWRNEQSRVFLNVLKYLCVEVKNLGLKCLTKSDILTH